MKKIDPIYALQAGWVRYKNNAGMYTAFTVVLFIGWIILFSIAAGMGVLFEVFGERVSGLITNVFLTAITVFSSLGIAHFAREDERGTAVEFGDFFSAFSVNQKQLLGVVLITTLLSQLLSFFMPDSFMALGRGEIDPNSIDPAALIDDITGSLGILIFIILVQIVFSVGFMFSSYRASLDGADVMESLKWSFPRAWSNFLRIVLVGFLSSIIVMILGFITLFLGFLVLIPWMMLVQFEMYDQLCEKPEGLDPVVEEFDYDN